jgi:hypothetical protein
MRLANSRKLCSTNRAGRAVSVRFSYGDDVAKAPKSQSNRRPWAAEDVKTLKSMARKEPASQIAKALKRTEGATRQKATALGISLNTTRGRAAGARRTAVKKAAPKKAAAKKAAPKKAAAKKGGRKG